MKVNSKMVRYWLGVDKMDIYESSLKEVIKDYVDIANGKYDPTLLKQDILDTWRLNHGKA
tara:strand:- start:205 stop:384 length:180 start_codon:yes stop_codon:yes gene_type:complete